jgi:hypothetical protein
MQLWIICRSRIELLTFGACGAWTLGNIAESKLIQLTISRIPTDFHWHKACSDLVIDILTS